jgi:hypothetical protein
LPTAQGPDATLTARTAPGASCSIVINYKSGPSNARGLETKTGDVNGRVSWTWKVGPLTTPGSYRIDVIAVLGDDRVPRGLGLKSRIQVIPDTQAQAAGSWINQAA